MLTKLLGPADWMDAPAEMEFSMPYASLLDNVTTLAAELSSPQGDSSAQELAARQAKAVSLYLKAPGIVNVLLNYKICVEHDLPLHPTVYYELAEASKYHIDHGLPVIDMANRLYLQAIGLARSAIRLDPSYKSLSLAFRDQLPPVILNFVYTGIRDKYTWRGSDPLLIGRLAQSVRKDFSPDVLVAAAHGSIMPALLLSEFLAIPLYFIRFSMFKRHDESPIVSFSDTAYLSTWRNKAALFYDEDVAGGRTLSLFAEKLAPLFAESKTACSIHHAGAAIRPDYCGKTWWD
ncbi:MAG: phosphoribosyltransferase domain-containing protein [Spirochaetaceae bacterium]|nr:phosphoribosyltransferase domain-containing protein [Spirochaetaceae bacterium]